MPKLISLNIEGSRHWDRITPFLKKEHAHVVCLQEAFKNDVVALAKDFKMSYAFAPMTFRHYHFEDPRSPEKQFGVAILSRTPLKNVRISNYHMPAKSLKRYDGTDNKTKHATLRQVLLTAKVPSGKKLFPLATTHFTWTPNGKPDKYQKNDIAALLKTLEKMTDVALCGDFNVPLSINAVYDVLRKEFRDAIPRRYVSSMDLSLHRARHNPRAARALARYMVDYLFLRGDFRAKNVRLHAGVSDHKAIIATLVFG